MRRAIGFLFSALAVSMTMHLAAESAESDADSVAPRNHWYTPAETEKLLSDRLAIAEASGSSDELYGGLESLAGFYWTEKQYPKAETLYKRCLAIKVNGFGEKSPEAMSVVWIMAELYKSAGRMAEADPLFERCLEITDGPEFAAALSIKDKQTVGGKFITHVPEWTEEERHRNGDPYEERVWSSGYAGTTSEQRVAFALAYDRFRRLNISGYQDGRWRALLTTKGLIKISWSFAKNWWQTNSPEFAKLPDQEGAQQAWLRESILDADYLIDVARFRLHQENRRTAGAR